MPIDIKTVYLDNLKHQDKRSTDGITDMFQVSTTKKSYQIGYAGEKHIQQICQASRLFATRNVGKHTGIAGDLRLIDNETGIVVHVEIKTSIDRGNGYQFCLSKNDKHGVTSTFASDILVLVCISADTRNVDYFVIPVKSLEHGMKKLSITSPAKAYTGKYAQYRVSAYDLAKTIQKVMLCA